MWIPGHQGTGFFLAGCWQWYFTPPNLTPFAAWRGGLAMAAIKSVLIKKTLPKVSGWFAWSLPSPCPCSARR
jgi:hypothetical protein